MISKDFQAMRGINSGDELDSATVCPFGVKVRVGVEVTDCEGRGSPDIA